MKANVKGLSKSELTVLVYLMVKGICKPKQISSQLEIDLSFTYKILKNLENKMYINKVNDNDEIEYIAKEHMTL